MRWLTRAASSWWTIGVLGTLVFGYGLLAHMPLLDRYVWQWRLFDTTQQRMLNWWPFMTAAWLLAAAVLWAALRRLPMRWDSLGRYVCMLGLAIVLVSQTWAFRHQSVSIAAVPIAEQKMTGQVDPLSLTYTTRAGHESERVVVVMVGGTQPIAVPVDGLPRWNDAAGDELPSIKLHDEPRLTALLDYHVRITPVAYVAQGKLQAKADGTKIAMPTKPQERHVSTLPYPAGALLALRIEVEPDEGEASTTTVWLPFEPTATDSLVPKRFYPVEGLGSVGLSFRPASVKLPFAMALNTQGDVTLDMPTIFIADAESDGRLLQPSVLTYEDLKSTSSYTAIMENGQHRRYAINFVASPSDTESNRALLLVTHGQHNSFITAGMIAFVLGVALDFLMGWIGPKPKRNITPPKPNTAP